MEIAIAIVVFIAAAFAVELIFRHYFGKASPSTTNGTTAFAKVATADDKIADAKGKISALQSAATEKSAQAETLRNWALNAHARLDLAHEDLNEVHELLG